jgi:hypothetical protein
MTTPLIPRIETTLKQWIDPYLQTDLITAECLRRIHIDQSIASIEIELRLSRRRL